MMEKLSNTLPVQSLTDEELIEINAGNERKDEKRAGWFKTIWDKITGAGN